MYQLRNSVLARSLVALTVGLLVASCGDSTGPEEEEHEPEVATMRLTVGSQTINVAEDGTVTGGPIVIPVGNTTISAQFLLASGQPEPLVTADVFQLNVDSDNTGVAGFTRTAAFGGSLVGTAAGSTILRFALFHIEEGHEDFGPFPVSVTVQ